MLPSPRTWLTIAAALSLLTALVAASSTSFAASSSSTVVSANVLSSTTLDLTGCGATTRDFGLVQPLATVRSSGACAVAFSSSNSTATLSASQRDRFGTAMTQASSVWTARSGTATYSAVDATSSSDLWVGGSPLIPGTAVLRHSVDSGATWSDVTPCAGATDIKELIAYSATEVLTVGNKVCRTTDGGATWSIIATPFALPTGPHLGAAAGTNVVWLNANGGGRVMRSADRGQTWTAITIPAISYGIRTIAARGTTTVVAMADRVNVGGTTRSMLAYSSTDSGVTWNEAVVRTTSTLTSSVGDVDVSTSGRFAVLGSAGYGLWSSDDNGVTWASRGTPGVVRLRHLVGTTWLTTNYQFGNMRISTDDAVSWSSFFPNGGDPRSIIQAVTKERGTNHVVMVGSNEQVLRSTTLGSTWSPVAPLQPSYLAVVAFDRQRIAAVGTNGSSVYTSDGGTTVQAGSGCGVASYTEGVATGPLSGVVVGTGGSICRTTDAGATWQAVPSGTTNYLIGVVRSGGDGSLIAFSTQANWSVRSFDDGATWSPWNISATGAINHLESGPSGQVIVMSRASNGTMWVSTDGGATWTARDDGLATEIDSIGVSSDGVIVTAHEVDGANVRYLTRSTDGGATWTTILNAVIGDHVRDVVFASDRRAWIIGDSGAAARSDDAGLTFPTIANVSSVADPQRLLVLDANTFVASGTGRFLATNRPSVTVPDVAGGTGFTPPAGAFGICLQSVAAATAVWTPAGACDTTVAAQWRGVPATAEDPTATVATSALGAAATANVVFGLRTAATQAPGTYQADLLFTVTAP